VREVLNRTSGIGAVALLMVGILGAGLVLAPQASARTGGLMAGHATFGRGDFFRLGGQPLVRPGQVPPVIVSGSNPAFVNPKFGVERERHHRGFFGFGLPVAGFALSYGPYGPYGPYDQPIADAGVIARPLAVTPIPEGGDRIDRGNHGDCRSETRVVASEDGGERPIKITWCR
jgi:hypothetical protein